ncbi:Hypothetical_protein [Hexamita inflata]|uniref:Hypothetical_protein n=1 Tax=Hexamita inflata TaxID=28002 RepID=A0AA86RGE8_9EUKA|nr:Hypothetical protein HINF_LOCUS54280 [Hexamita inflata]
MKSKYNLPPILDSIKNLKQNTINSIDFFEELEGDSSVQSSPLLYSSVIFIDSFKNLKEQINQQVKAVQKLIKKELKIEKYLQEAIDTNIEVLYVNNYKIQIQIGQLTK